MRQFERVPLLLALTVGAALTLPTSLWAYEDCNSNGVDDTTDIAGSTSRDCNTNGVPDECLVTQCPPVELVFLIDTSFSMVGEIGAFCALIQDVVDDLSRSGMIAQAEILTIFPSGACPCCTDSVQAVYGTTTPGLPETLGDGCGSARIEDWAPATAIVAAEKPWTSDAVRVVLPVHGPNRPGRIGGTPGNGDWTGDRASALPAAFEMEAFLDRERDAR